MRLILTRHGETIENTQGVLQGHLPGRLSEQGKEQAKRLAVRLKDEKIDAMYSSDLARAVDTAQEIAKFHPRASLHLTQDLREVDLGSFTGKKKNEIDWNNRPADFETNEKIQQRAKHILEQVLHKHPNDTVVFVGHNKINRALLSVILDKTAEEIHGIEQPKNTSVYVFTITEDKKHHIHLRNDISHLEGI